MNSELSVAVQALTDQSRLHGEHTVLADALSRYLVHFQLPDNVFGELSFGPDVSARWSRALDDRITEATALRDRLGSASTDLLSAARDYAGADTDVAVDVSQASENGGALDPLLSRQYTQGSAPVGPDGLDLTSVRASHELPERLDPNLHIDSPGRDAMLAFTSEHLGTLERAEQLLREAERLDFKAPTAYLRELADVRPSKVRSRADLLSAVESSVDEMRQRNADSNTVLYQRWVGSGADAFTDRSSGIGDEIDTAHQRLSWLRRESDRTVALLETLLSDIAASASTYLDNVRDSRIGRITQAVELVEDARGYSADHVDPSGRNLMWGSLSATDLDAAVHVLYKRVWYLARAFEGNLTRANEEASTLLTEPDDPQV